MKKYLAFALLALFLTACATKPPVQEMAEARSAIATAQQMEHKTEKGSRMLKSAEQSLKEAAEAIDKKYYETARRKAVEAKRKAQFAASMKRNAPEK